VIEYPCGEVTSQVIKDVAENRRITLLAFY
jgi:hypothetical protein